MSKNLFNDSLNYLYLIFLHPVVNEDEKINALFQSKNLDPSHMPKELEDFSNSLKSRIYNSLKQELPAKWCDYGIEFKQKFDSMKNKVQNHDVQQQLEHDLEIVKENCKAFLKVLITQVESRLTFHLSVYGKLSLLSPKCILNKTKKPKFCDLPLLHVIPVETWSMVENQYKKITLTDWSEFFEKNKEEHLSFKFWGMVSTYSTGEKIFPFRELALYALDCFCLPVSNVEVEKIFSQMALVKTKLRNNMNTDTLSSMLRIRQAIHQNGCCTNFEPTRDMLALFTYAIYNTKKSFDNASCSSAIDSTNSASVSEATDCTVIDMSDS